MADSIQDVEVVVCGLTTVDIVARPIPLDQPVIAGRLHPLERIEATTGGIVSNSGIALRRLGIRTAAISCIGRDPWGELIRQKFQHEGIDARGLIDHPHDPTSATIVLVDASGQRSFLFCRGAGPHLSAEDVLARFANFRGVRWTLFGYLSLFPEFDQQLPKLLQTVRNTGCKTALDSAGSGGSGQTLRPMLPHLDLFVPSYDEAVCQTGLTKPREILRQLRAWGASQVVGVKLGEQGALLSPAPEAFIEVAAIRPDSPVVDTTGAGDAFYAGLIAGLVRGRSLHDAARLAAATAAACVTSLGATAGLRNWNQTCRLAGLATNGEVVAP